MFNSVFKKMQSNSTQILKNTIFGLIVMSLIQPFIY